VSDDRSRLWIDVDCLECAVIALHLSWPVMFQNRLIAVEHRGHDDHVVLTTKGEQLVSQHLGLLRPKSSTPPKGAGAPNALAAAPRRLLAGLAARKGA
jgi:hypothetical protein